jgi:hypothetical protein
LRLNSATCAKLALPVAVILPPKYAFPVVVAPPFMVSPVAPVPPPIVDDAKIPIPTVVDGLSRDPL